MDQTTSITIESTINATLEKVWGFWTDPKHIVNWAFASTDWEAPIAENDVRSGGRFKTVMAAKDKSASFDFSGTYTNIKEQALIEYDMDRDLSPDNFEAVSRHVKITFTQLPEGTHVIQTFDIEKINPVEMQRSGWQAILDNFKKYVEHNQ